MAAKQLPIPAERIEQAILAIRGEKVLLARRRPGPVLWRHHGRPGAGGQTEPGPLPGRLHVSADRGRMGRFEITNSVVPHVTSLI